MLQIFDFSCVPTELPQFVGYDGEFLYFAAFSSKQTKDPLQVDFVLKEIYKLDHQTKKKTIMTNRNFPEGISHVALSDDNKSTLMITDKGQNFTMDLESNSIIKEATSSATN